jgi:hypothetical protein
VVKVVGRFADWFLTPGPGLTAIILRLAEHSAPDEDSGAAFLF